MRKKIPQHFFWIFSIFFIILCMSILFFQCQEQQEQKEAYKPAAAEPYYEEEEEARKIVEIPEVTIAEIPEQEEEALPPPPEIKEQPKPEIVEEDPTWEEQPAKPQPQQLSPSEIIEQEIKNLSEGQIEFSPPKDMTIGEKEKIRVRISKGTKIDLEKELKEMEEVQIEKIKVGTFMKVRLEGDNFDINTLSHAEQIVSEGEITQWEWDVTPRKTGIQTLNLCVTVRIKIPGNGEEKFDLPVFERIIIVQVDPLYPAKKFFEKNWEKIAVAIIIAIGIWIIQRILSSIKKKKAES